MTTNRVRSIDSAFESRIHISMHYHDLSLDARRAIWTAFVMKAHGHVNGESSSECASSLSEHEFEKLAEVPLNGRQIRNAVRTACAFAASEQETLSYKHLRNVLDIMAEFQAEMKAARDTQTDAPFFETVHRITYGRADSRAVSVRTMYVIVLDHPIYHIAKTVIVSNRMFIRRSRPPSPGPAIEPYRYY